MASRRTKGKVREELVVAAAGQAIAELGLANVRVADVAERAGMTPGHVTYYFPSKTHLLIQAISQSEDELVATVEAELVGIDDPWKRLFRLVQLSAAQEQRDPGWLLWFEVWSSGVTDPEIARVSHQLDARWRQVLEDVIVFGRERGVFETSDPRAAAFLLSATIDGLSAQLVVGAPSFSRDKLMRLFGSAARAYLGPRPS